MHIVKLIERRYPNGKGSARATLTLLSASLLFLGLGLLILR